MAFIDANIPIYAAGRAHPYKEPCANILGLVAETPLAFVTDAEVLRELVHRYLAQDRWELGRGHQDLCPGDAGPDRAGLRQGHSGIGGPGG